MRNFIILTVLFAFSLSAFAGNDSLTVEQKVAKSSKAFKATFEAAKQLTDDDAKAFAFAKIIYKTYSDVNTRHSKISSATKTATAPYRKMLEAAAVSAAQNYIATFSDTVLTNMDATALLIIQSPEKFSDAELQSQLEKWGRRFYVYNAGPSQAVSEMEKWLQKIEKAEKDKK